MKTFKLGSIVVKLSRKSLTVTTAKAAKAASLANTRKNRRVARLRATVRMLRRELDAATEPSAAAWASFHRVID